MQVRDRWGMPARFTRSLGIDAVARALRRDVGSNREVEIHMAQPIPLHVTPRNPVEERRARLDRTPEEHAAAVLAADDVLPELHDRGVLEVVKSGLAASDELLETAVSTDSLRGLRAAVDFLESLGRHLNSLEDAAQERQSASRAG
jgi:hypothetical protein